MNVQISVVIPTYRRPELLLRCLKALTAQRIERWAYEIVVVSDGPDGLTQKAISAFNRRRAYPVKYYWLPEKKGPAAARNYGWLKAKGELIAFTDDDCIPNESWLLSYRRAYELISESAFTGQTIVPIPEHPTDYERNISHLQNADFITANCACPKKILLITGGFDEKFPAAWREDSDFEFNLLQSGIPITKIKNATVIHPVRQARWGVSIADQKKTMYNALLYKKHPQLYRQKIQPSPPVYYYCIIMSFLLLLTGVLTRSASISVPGLVLWLGMSLLFAWRRLKLTSRHPVHIAEMAITSLLIPLLSIYWQFYGALKYRVLFI
ncbi:MAG: glycosyltransferase family 2 protein [Mucilaginibacter sp.]